MGHKYDATSSVLFMEAHAVLRALCAGAGARWLVLVVGAELCGSTVPGLCVGVVKGAHFEHTLPGEKKLAALTGGLAGGPCLARKRLYADKTCT